MKFKEISEENKMKISCEIEFNIKAEAEASEYYFNLIQKVADEDKIIIQGLISDELNHVIILGKLQEKYSKIFPSEYDPLLLLKKKEGEK